MRRRAGFSHSGAQSEYHVGFAAPLGLWGFSSDHGFEHRERRGIGGGVRAAGLAEDAVDLGELRDQAVLDLQQALCASPIEMPRASWSACRAASLRRAAA
jgi:hypothetical protein